MISFGQTSSMKAATPSFILFLFLSILIGDGCTGSSSPQHAPSLEEVSAEEISQSMIGTWQLLTVLTIYSTTQVFQTNHAFLSQRG